MNMEQRLRYLMLGKLEALKLMFSKQLTTLHAVSPLATLERGYAIVTHGTTLLVNQAQVEPGDAIDIRLLKGRLSCRVIKSLSINHPRVQSKMSPE